MRFNLIIFLVLSISWGFLFAQFTQGETVTELSKQLKDTNDSKKRAALLNQIAELSLNRSTKESIRSAKQAVAMAKEADDPVGEARGLRNIGYGFAVHGDFGAALKNHLKALEIYKNLNLSKESMKTLVAVGNTFFRAGDWEKAIEYYYRGLEACERIDYKKGKATLYNNIGAIYLRWKKYDKALEHMLDSLKIKQLLKNSDPVRIALTMDNIGVIYRELGAYDKALEYHQKVAKVMLEHKDNDGRGRVNNNIGLVFQDKGDYHKALEFHRKSLGIRKQLGNRGGVASSYYNMSTNFRHLREYEQALEYLAQAQKINQDIGSQRGIALCMVGTAMVYKKSKQYNDALELFLDALKIANQHNVKDVLETSYKGISDIYDELGDKDKSLEFFKKYSDVKEETFSKEIFSKIRTIEADFIRDKIEREMTRKQKKEFFYYSIFIGTILVLFLLMGSYRLYRRKSLLPGNRDNLPAGRETAALHPGNPDLSLTTVTTATGTENQNKPKSTPLILSDSEAETLLKRIITAMEKDKLYTDSSITVRGLAKQLSMTQREVSRAINERLNKNFNDFINHYRVEEAKKRLAASENKEIQILDIAFDVGFNSKSSFNSVFKKFTGMSPSQYKTAHNR